MVGVLTCAVGYNSPFIISPRFDGVDHHAPHLEVVGLVNAYGLIFGVGGSQFDVALVAVRHQIAVEVEALVQVFLCRAGKAGPDFGRELKVQFLLKFAVYDVNTVHKCNYMCCAKIQLLCEMTIANVRNNCYCIIDFSRL